MINDHDHDDMTYQRMVVSTIMTNANVVLSLRTRYWYLVPLLRVKCEYRSILALHDHCTSCTDVKRWTLDRHRPKSFF